MKKWLFALALTGCTIDMPELPDRAEKSSEMSLLDKKKGWSVSGQLQTYNTSKSISLQADFDEPGEYTLQFDVQYPAVADGIPGPLNGNIIAEADIFWSVEGNFVQRKISLTQGATISGIGQGVKVVIRDRSVPILGSTNIATYNVSAQVVKGARSFTQPPVYIRSGDDYDGVLTDFDISVPQNIGVNQIWVNTLFYSVGPLVNYDTGAFSIIFYRGTTAGFGGEINLVLNPDTKGWIPIPPGTNKIRISPSTIPAGATAMIASIMWGVDG